VLFSTLHPVYPGQNFFWTPDEVFLWCRARMISTPRR
jgi:hypothetical protein